DEAQYLAAYELIIPVLCHVESGQELHWPFTEKQVQLFVTEILG
ncbi:MAG: glutaredoxin family protein, partial [Methylococcales bacterium]|nr:glutaredoxin family protein [Methylococcales bacterium]MBT6523716.1 glutaredoxin family protein [Methylococcales bacterium]MBT7968440.1 glutaredoxin family protein [Methylococcales bacterium]